MFMDKHFPMIMIFTVVLEALHQMGNVHQLH